MIIEITGASGSGKTTLLKKISNTFPELIIVTDTDDIKEKSKWLEVLNFIKWGLYFIFSCPMYWKYFISLFSYMKFMEDTLFNKLNMLRNSIKKISIYVFYKRKYADSLVIIDEGISHVPYNLITTASSRSIPIEKIYSGFKDLITDTSLLILDVPLSVIVERLLKRGHNRINIKNIERFAEENNRITKEIKIIGKKYFNKIFLIDEKSSVREIVKNIIEYKKHI